MSPLTNRRQARLSMHGAWVRVAILLSMIVLVVDVGGAEAHHEASPNTQLWGSSYSWPCDTHYRSQCVANNSGHRYQLVGLTTSRANATLRALDLFNDNSEVAAIAVTSDPDVVVIDANRLDIDLFAWGWCLTSPPPPAPPTEYGGSDASHTRWCRPQYVIWNSSSEAAPKVNSTAKYNYIGCHEIGHTLGLRHRSTTASCMIPAALPPSNPASIVPTSQSPTAGDYDRIDIHYPLFLP
jgi:Matrixin